MKNGVSRHTVIKKNSQDGFTVDLVKSLIHEKSIKLIHIEEVYTFNSYKETIRSYEAVRTKAVQTAADLILHWKVIL
jgi:hypothetical protein